MREHGLLDNQRTGRLHGSRAHDGRITTERVDLMWGTDLTLRPAVFITRQARPDAPAAKYASEIGKSQVLEGFDAAGKPRLRAPKLAVTTRMLLLHTAGFGYWIDRQNGIGGFWATQVFPFADPTSFGGYMDFETAVYGSLAVPKAA